MKQAADQLGMSYDYLRDRVVSGAPGAPKPVFRTPRARGWSYFFDEADIAAMTPKAPPAPPEPVDFTTMPTPEAVVIKALARGPLTRRDLMRGALRQWTADECDDLLADMVSAKTITCLGTTGRKSIPVYAYP